MSTPLSVASLTGPTKYVLVEAPDEEEKPSPLARPPTLRLHPVVAKASKRARSAKNGAATAWLSFYSATSGAANTAFSIDIPVAPSSDANWSSWQATFDEFKVLEAELYWLAYFTVVPTALPANTPNAAMAYDPTGTTLPTSVNQVLEHERFTLLNIAGGASTSYQASPQAVQSNGGYLHLKVRLPNTPDLSLVKTNLSVGMWRPTTDASTYTWGDFIGYCAAGGNTSVIRIESFIRMKVAFRWLR